jgi:hypothetical protein
MSEKKIALAVLPWVLVLSEPAFEKNCPDYDVYAFGNLPAVLQESNCNALKTIHLPHNHFELSPDFPSVVSVISASGGQHYTYQLELECPTCRREVGHLCDCPSEMLSEVQANFGVTLGKTLFLTVVDTLPLYVLVVAVPSIIFRKRQPPFKFLKVAEKSYGTVVLAFLFFIAGVWIGVLVDTRLLGRSAFNGYCRFQG